MLITRPKQIHPLTRDHWAKVIFGTLLAGILSYAITQINVGDNPPGHDFWWSKEIAREFIQGRDPYALSFNQFQVPYPLPVFVIGTFFLPFSAPLSAAIFNGSIIFLILWGLCRENELWRWPMFISLPFVSAFILPQWSPLLIAAWFFPVIAPYLVLIKPQNALPIALARWSWRGIFIASVILLITLIRFPNWPWTWLSLTGNYLYIIPFLALPFGPLLLLSARYWRYPRGRLILVMSLLPLRAYYDLPILWLIPQTGRQVWILTLLSWLPLTFFQYENAFIQPAWTVIGLFIPALCMLIWNHDEAGLRKLWGKLGSKRAA